MFISHYQRIRGFSLIEILVAVAIITVLSTVIIASVVDARTRSRDTARLNFYKEVEKALNLYFADNGQFPPYNEALGTTADFCTGNANWNSFIADLGSYMEVPCNTFAEEGATNSYRYDSAANQNYQTYGLGIINPFAHPSSAEWSIEDGGNSNSEFELGEDPSYCRRVHGNSWFSGHTSRCNGNLD